MAMAAGAPCAARRRRDLCSRGARLAAQMRADVADLLDAYVQQQGLDAAAAAAAAAPASVPAAAAERWHEQTPSERLRANAAAYGAFRPLLAAMAREQREQGGPGALHEPLAALRLRVAALAHHLHELLRLEGPAAPRDGGAGADEGSNDDDGTDDGADDGTDDGADDGAGARLGLFERRLRGLAVLRELARWAVRSARDLRLIAKPGGAADADGSP